MYTSPDGTFWTGHLKKKTIGNKEYYKFIEMSTLGPTIYATDWRTEGMFKYVCLENKDDIDKFDCDGKTPICGELNYKVQGKNKHCYIYIIDK